MNKRCKADDSSDKENFENLKNLENKSHGLISSIRLVNFMCHDNLFLEFGPNINFIVGLNGSGKSAILAGLMICLGVSASKTQRGHRLENFIKEERDFATVTVILNNLSNTFLKPFKPQDYGKNIIIERKLLRDSPVSYVVKSEDGRKISSKKEEVMAICKHFKLQVDNPMTILTQEIAKNYLASSSDAAKYEFFERGTMLHQLKIEYNEMKDKSLAMELNLKEAEKVFYLRSEILIYSYLIGTPET